MKKSITTPKLALVRHTVTELDRKALASAAGGKPSAGGGCTPVVCK